MEMVASSWCVSKAFMVCGQGTCTMWYMIHVAFAFCFPLSFACAKLFGCKVMLSSTPIIVIPLLISISLTYKTNKEKGQQVYQSQVNKKQLREYST